MSRNVEDLQSIHRVLAANVFSEPAGKPRRASPPPFTGLRWLPPAAAAIDYTDERDKFLGGIVTIDGNRNKETEMHDKVDDVILERVAALLA